MKIQDEGLTAAREPGSSGDLLADRRFAWAAAALSEGDVAGAADLFEQCLERAPGWAAGWLALGEARRKLGLDEAARAAFAQADALDVGGALGVKLRLAATGAIPPPARAGEPYVRSLFDQYAPRFDAHLTQTLGYSAPARLRAAVERVRPGRFARMLDLGCGTGLAGRAFAPQVAQMNGVDLSPAMLARAQATGLYARLVAGDLAAFLADEPPGAADLAVAADVFVYVGDLAAIFAACARALARGGVFAFTTQCSEAGDWRVGDDLRFAHAPAYLRRLAAAGGWSVPVLERASTRRDAGADVEGLVAVLTRP